MLVFLSLYFNSEEVFCRVPPGDFAELVLTSSTGYMGGAGNYLGASLGAGGGYGAGNVCTHHSTGNSSHQQVEMLM